MWQKCPICDGEGRVTSNGLSSSVHQVCSVCNGAKIISELNGLPAQSVPTVSKMEIAQTAMTKLFTNLKSMGIKIPQGVEMIYLLLEKEQIENAWEDGKCSFSTRFPEQYYNETYGGQVNVEQYAWDNPVLSRKDVYELFNDVFKDKKMEGAYKISASKQVYQFNTRLRELAKQKAIDLTKDTTTSPNTQNK